MARFTMVGAVLTVMMASAVLAEDAGIVTVTIVGEGEGTQSDWQPFINNPASNRSKSFYEVLVTSSDGTQITKSYTFIPTKNMLLAYAPSTFKLGRFKSDDNLKVTLKQEEGVKWIQPNSPDYLKNGVQVKDTESDYKICIDAIDCKMRVSITHTYTPDPAIMEVNHWNIPDCMAPAETGSCNVADLEAFKFYEFVADADTFISVMSVDIAVPQLRKNNAGNTRYVDQYTVSIDIGEGTAAKTKSDMNFKNNGISIGDESIGTDCRIYDFDLLEGPKQRQRGYRHLAAFNTKLQFVLDQPMQVSKGTTYWVRVQYSGDTTPAAVNGCQDSSIGRLGQDATDCTDECTLRGLSADCAKGCEAAHPKYMTDAALCAELACCGGETCGGTQPACLTDARAGCEFALDANQAGSEVWTSNVGAECIDTLTAQETSGGLVFTPTLGGPFNDGFITEVSCVGEIALNAGSCAQYACDRGVLIGLNADGKYDGCTFQQMCQQGCLASALQAAAGQSFIIPSVAEVTLAGKNVVVACDPDAVAGTGKMVGKGTWECTFADDAFAWVRRDVNGGGTGNCVYEAAEVTEEPQITLENQDIDSNGNIVARTTTETTTSGTTVTTRTTKTTTTPTVTIERKTLEFTFANADIPNMSFESQGKFRVKVIEWVTGNSNSITEDNVYAVTFASVDTPGRKRRQDIVVDEITSVVTVHLDNVTDDVLAATADSIESAMVTYAFYVITDATYSLAAPPLQSTASLPENYEDELVVALSAEEGDDDYGDDGSGEIAIATDSSLTGAEKFGLAILIIMILGMVAGIAWMVHKMQTHPKYKRQSSSQYSSGSAEAASSMPMIELDPFGSREGSVVVRSQAAKRRTSNIAATTAYAAPTAAVAVQAPRQSQMIVPTQPSIRAASTRRAPSGQPPRNIAGFAAPAPAQQPISRSDTELAEDQLDLEAAPVVFGASKSIRPASYQAATGTATLAVAPPAEPFRERKATLFDEPEVAAEVAAAPTSPRVLNLDGFGGGGETSDANAATGGSQAEQWKRAESLRHTGGARDARGSQHFVEENSDFVSVDGKLQMKKGLKHVEHVKRESMIRRAESGDPDAIAEMEETAKTDAEIRAINLRRKGSIVQKEDDSFL